MNTDIEIEPVGYSFQVENYKLWTCNLQYSGMGIGLGLLRFTEQVRPNHCHPITHLLNYTASFPRRPKSYSAALYKHLKSQSQEYLT